MLSACIPPPHKKNRKNEKAGINDGLENVLSEWFQQKWPDGNPTDEPILCATATEAAARMTPGFKISNHWL